MADKGAQCRRGLRLKTARVQALAPVERLCYTGQQEFSGGAGQMDEVQKLKLLGEGAADEACSSCVSPTRLSPDEAGRWVYLATRSDGRRVRLLKVLQSNACDRDCFYCANRRDRTVRRTSFRPEELAGLFDVMQRRGLVDGIFLSSGIGGSVHSVMDRMIATVEIIRKKCQFQGYVHLKILPGVDRGAVARAVELADRVSVNLEAPSPDRLVCLTHRKDFVEDLLTRLAWAHQDIRLEMHRRITQTTQLVVGAADETDQEILDASASLYRRYNLSRVYYSAFHPVPDTPLENHPATPSWREQRLYQADWLLREYGFRAEELCFDDNGNLSEWCDPKLAWALRHPERFPVEINQAGRQGLVRVPGIGPKSAQRILDRRRQGRFRDLRHLKRVGVAVRRAAPFILLDGRIPPSQLPLPFASP